MWPMELWGAAVNARGEQGLMLVLPLELTKTEQKRRRDLRRRWTSGKKMATGGGADDAETAGKRRCSTWAAGSWQIRGRTACGDGDLGPRRWALPAGSGRERTRAAEAGLIWGAGGGR